MLTDLTTPFSYQIVTVSASSDNRYYRFIVKPLNTYGGHQASVRIVRVPGARFLAHLGQNALQHVLIQWHDVLGTSVTNETVWDAQLLGYPITATLGTALGGQFVIRLETGRVSFLFATLGRQHLVLVLSSKQMTQTSLSTLYSFAKGVVRRVVDDNDIRGRDWCSYRYPGSSSNRLNAQARRTSFHVLCADAILMNSCRSCSKIVSTRGSRDSSLRHSQQFLPFMARFLSLIDSWSAFPF